MRQARTAPPLLGAAAGPRAPISPERPHAQAWLGALWAATAARRRAPLRRQAVRRAGYPALMTASIDPYRMVLYHAQSGLLAVTGVAPNPANFKPFVSKRLASRTRLACRRPHIDLHAGSGRLARPTSPRLRATGSG